jgi:spermidine synthase
VRAYWSPYQKLVMHTLAKTAPFTDGEYMINVNNTGYQALLNLDPAHVAAHPEAYPQEQNGFSQYDIPLLLHPAPDAVLIVGAGAGNDAAGALRQGARRVVAVEIDPAIIAMGKAHHPEHPYDSPRVTVVNNDARSFFATCAERFDVIAFGLLDSHTTTAMTNARLDHYVYTRESLEHVRSLLRPGGIVFLSFEPEKPYIADRMGRALGEVFGARPLVFRIPSNRMGFGGAAFVAGDVAMAEQRIAGNPALAGLIQRWTQEAPLSLSYTTPIATDDWPYIYLDKPRIPALFGLLAVLLVLLLLLGQRHSGVRLLASAKWGRPQWHFFFLGAAFLLLEVQNVSKAAVVLGNTWSVNAVIISGVLGMILVANLLAAKWPAIPMKPVYALLVGSCLALYFVDLSSLAFLPYFAKAAAVSVLTTLPMLFSGIVFIHAYAGTANKDLAIGANLLGALVGGVLQSVTFLTGIRALLLIVAALYLLAILTRVRGPQVLNAREVPGGLALDPRSA